MGRASRWLPPSPARLTQTRRGSHGDVPIQPAVRTRGRVVLLLRGGGEPLGPGALGVGVKPSWARPLGVYRPNLQGRWAWALGGGLCPTQRAAGFDDRVSTFCPNTAPLESSFPNAVLIPGTPCSLRAGLGRTWAPGSGLVVRTGLVGQAGLCQQPPWYSQSPGQSRSGLAHGFF